MNRLKKIILIITILMFTVLVQNVNAYSADVAIESSSKLTKGQTVEITISVKNINATETGISVLKGKITYDKNVFESYTVETCNGWKSENATDTFLFDKSEGVTSNEDVAKLKFVVKEDTTKESATIQFTNITVSGLLSEYNGPGDIKVASTSITLYSNQDPTVKVSNSNNQILSSKTDKSELPKTGENNIILILLIAVILIACITYRKYNNIDK